MLVTLTVSRLSHLFKPEKGCRLRSYLVECRLELAARVLQSSRNAGERDTPQCGIRASVQAFPFTSNLSQIPTPSQLPSGQLFHRQIKLKALASD